MLYFRLKPSTIPGAGVGVFATALIPPGTPLPELFAEDDVVRYPRAGFEARDLPPDVREHFAT